MLLHEWCTSGFREVLIGLFCASSTLRDSNKWGQVGSGLSLSTEQWPGDWGSGDCLISREFSQYRKTQFFNISSWFMIGSFIVEGLASRTEILSVICSFCKKFYQIWHMTGSESEAALLSHAYLNRANRDESSGEKLNHICLDGGAKKV